MLFDVGRIFSAQSKDPLAVVVFLKRRQGIRQEVAGQEDVADEDADEGEREKKMESSHLLFVFVLTGDWHEALMSWCVCTHIGTQ